MSRRHTASARGFTLVELLIVILLIAFLLTLCIPAIQNARDEARRLQCQNNLKQIGLALHNYHDSHKTFPPGWTQHHAQPGLESRFGWAVFITPFIDQAPLYKRLNFQTQRPEPLELFQTRLAVYRCADDTTDDKNLQRGNFGTMNYSANFGPMAPPRWLHNGLSDDWPGQLPTPVTTFGLAHLNSKVGIAMIRDGTSNTLLVGERSATSAAAIWMGVRGNEYESDQVTDCEPGHEINADYASFSSQHGGGANFVFCDGSVRFLSETIESGPGEKQNMKTFQKLSHRDDRMPVGEF